MTLIQMAERGRLPDWLLRIGMRRMMRARLDEPTARWPHLRAAQFRDWLAELRASPIAINTSDANVQHYEVPAEFFHAHLGPRLKYSCCWYETGRETLAEAEEAMLAIYAERAQLKDGMRILDLGCGWGSLSLWLAERYPNSQIVGLSNSHGQREFITARAAERGYDNLTIYTGNVVDFEFSADQLGGGFDRVMSIEMFEHMRNYGLLLAKIRGWLKDDGKLFVHIFAHPTLSYPYEVRDGSDWMTQYFFLGGIMPSEHLLAHFQDDLRIVDQWWVDGRHYQQTSEHWLQGMDGARDPIELTFRQAYGDDWKLWVQRWRMFYMAVAE
ncbi:MAG: class I SAM-dependent methyltransferase, partial [Betaproteobacteria bacterium]|nr:class I SAM-dependent methyltransferase [Betaproteobacteria bacterium]